MTDEDIEDAKAIKEFRKKMAAGEEELIPADIAKRLIMEEEDARDVEKYLKEWQDNDRRLEKLSIEVEFKATISSNTFLSVNDARFLMRLARDYLDITDMENIFP